MRTVISWAGSIGAAAGQTPTSLLGPPDGHSYTITDQNSSVTLQDFRPRSYAGVVDLLSLAEFGDRVTPDLLVRGDLLAFEHNGDAPGPAGGWESCDWRFTDSVGTLAFHFDTASVPPVRDPHVIANGSISGSVYGGFFEIPEATIRAENPAAPTLDDVVISFLLLRLRPEVDPLAGGLQVTLSVNAGTPDPDALGVVTHLPDELEYTRFDTCPG